MCTPCEQPPKFYVYGFWHCNKDKDLVTKDWKPEVHEFDNIDDACEFMKKVCMSNVNITVCLNRDEWYVNQNILKENQDEI